MAIKYKQNFCDYFCCLFMKGGSFCILNHKQKIRKVRIMKINEYEYYNNLANWSFDEINYASENFTNWVYEDEIVKHTTKDSKILDLGTAAGEKVLKLYLALSVFLNYIISCPEIKCNILNVKNQMSSTFMKCFNHISSFEFF